MATYTLISSNVLTTTAASVTFSSIPATFTDLVLRSSPRATSSTVKAFRLNFNGVTGTSYSNTLLRGNGAAASSLRDSSNSYAELGLFSGDDITADIFGSVEVYIPNYTVSQNKAISGIGVSERDNTTAFIEASAALFSDTAAITSIEITTNGGDFIAGSSFYLYGISNA